jgi:uncharacterized DUF497 family protein
MYYTVATEWYVLMFFEWDAAKNSLNLAKHGVSLESARLVFDDPHALSYQDREVDGEERWQTMGVIGRSVVVLVAHTYREEKGEAVVRLISARKATSSEKRAYEEGQWPPG